ncbi:MAG: nucleotidyltransferase domain-containing protein [Desulfitobacteriaceae bacterium]
MIMDYKELILNDPKYDFLKADDHLGDNIILLTLSGSISYGTNIESSDTDIRGIALERPNELLGLDHFEQFENQETDTTIFSFRKLVNLLLNCNPNCIEILATNPEHIVIITEEGKKLRDNLGLFLSQRAANSFSGYATAQLRRLENALARDSYPQPEKEKHILKSINAQMYHLKEKYRKFTDSEIELYIADSEKEDYETEIFLDINLKGYPLRDFKNIYSEMSNLVTEYGKLNKRNKKKDDLHLYKHAMHLIRLLLMGTEILKGEPVRTFRKERKFLLDIRNEKYSFEQIFDMVNIYEKEFLYAKENSPLPVTPDKDKINELVIEINKKAIK